MNKIFVYIGLGVLFTLSANSLSAQERVKMEIGYNPAMPVGSFKDFMGKNSFRGYNGKITYAVTENLRVGLGVAFSDYYEKIPRSIYETKDGTISAVVTTSVQTTPILVKAEYDLIKDSWIRPYVGLGAGFNFINYNQYLGQFSDGKTAFKPAVAADAGVNIPFNKVTRSAGIELGANFNYMPFKYNDVKNLNNWGLHLGVFFPLRQ